MQNYFLKGIVIGMMFGIPAGAVGVMTMQRTLRYGSKAGLLTGLGSSVADCFYACVGAFGVTIISDFLLRYDRMINVFGGGFLFVMGFVTLLSKNPKNENTAGITGGVPLFLTSFMVGITNPAAILTFLVAFSWFDIVGTLSIVNGLQLVCGVFLGTYLWWGGLTMLTTWVKKKAKHKHLENLHRVFGMIVMLIGVVVVLKK